MAFAAKFPLLRSKSHNIIFTMFEGFFTETAKTDVFIPNPQIIKPPGFVAGVDIENTTFSGNLRNLADNLKSKFSVNRSNKKYEISDKKIDNITEDTPAFIYDGRILGADDKSYSPDTALCSVKPVMPSSMKAEEVGNFRIVFINGMSTSPKRVLHAMQLVADSTGMPVVGIYNATNGDFSDVVQAIGDKSNISQNSAAETLCKQIIAFTKNNECMRIVGDSQGALITSRALSNAKSVLIKSGFSQSDIEERLGNFRIETFGGAAWSYPDGPRYVHYVCEQDPVPFHFGLSKFGLDKGQHKKMQEGMLMPDWMKALAAGMWLCDIEYFCRMHPGKDSRIIRFKIEEYEDWLDTHRLETYIKHRLPFDKAAPSSPDSGEQSFTLAGFMIRTPKWLLTAVCLYYLTKCTRKGSRYLLKKAFQTVGFINSLALSGTRKVFSFMTLKSKRRHFSKEATAMNAR